MAVDHNNPQSRNEEILIATIDGNEYNKAPQSRMEELLLELKETIEEGGGGGGTSDYESLSNQPQINGETLIGDKTGADLGLVDAEEGKGLSTNDYDDNEKAAVAAATSAISAMKDGTDLDSFGDVEVALLDKADTADLGTAAAKDSTNAVTAGSTDLVESGAVKDAIDVAVAAAYHHAGTKTVAQLTHDLLVVANEGNVYNITDSGTTTSDFIEGIGKTIDEGSNVGICKVGNTYMFDLLSGFVDTTNFVQKSQTAGLLKNDGTVNDEIEEDVSKLKSGLTDLTDHVDGDATTYPYADVITINDAVPANLADCNVKVEPVQDLHGYDKPWVGGAGKNKLDYDDNTTGFFANGCTVNSIQNYVISLTASASDMYIGNYNNAGGLFAKSPCKVGDSYKIVVSDSSISKNYVTFLDDNNSVVSAARVDLDSFTVPEGATKMGFRIGNGNAVSGSTYTFTIMVVNSTETDATFAPYTNICPISGHTEAVVTRLGRNLLPTLSAQTTVNGITYTPNSDGSVTLNGTATNFSNIDLGRGELSLLADTYTASATQNGVGNVLFYTYKNTSPAQVITGTGSFTLTETTEIFFRIGVESGTRLTNVTVYPQIEVGDTATSYVPHEKTYTLALGDTIYGGTIRIGSDGNVYMDVTHGIIDLGDLTWTLSPTQNANKNRLYCSDLSPAAKSIQAEVLPDAICSCYKTVTFGETFRCYTGISVSNAYVTAYDANYTDASVFTTDMTGQTLCYELATPFTVQLTPQQIQLLQGTNTLYADTGDISVTVNGVSGAIGAVQTQANATDNALAQLAADIAEQLPDAPTTDGTYILTVTVADGAATYSWESAT